MAAKKITKAKKKPTLERSIYFYRIHAGTFDGKPRTLDLSPYVEQVRDLPFAQDSARYWAQPSGDPIALWTDDDATINDRFALASVRRSALPRRELNGKLSELDMSDGSGLHEPIHVRLFDDNLVGVEFNFYGPRPTKLSDYLSHALGGESARFKLEALLRQDALEELDKQKQLRLVELQVRSAYAAQLTAAKHGRMGKVLNAASKSGASVVGIVLRPEPYKQNFLRKKITESVKAIASDEAMPTNAIQFKTKGLNEETGRIDSIDLLDDKLVSKQSIVRIGKNSRAIDPSSAYDAIGDAYNELKDQLLLASSIGAASPHA